MKEITDKTDKMITIEEKTGRRIESILHEYYIMKKLSVEDTAKLLGINKVTCKRWLQLANIDKRPKYEKIYKLKGVVLEWMQKDKSK